MTTTRITIYTEDAKAIRAARRILNRLVEAGLASNVHGENIQAVIDDLDAIDARIIATVHDTFSRNVTTLIPARRHLEPVA